MSDPTPIRPEIIVDVVSPDADRQEFMNACATFYDRHKTAHGIPDAVVLVLGGINQEFTANWQVRKNSERSAMMVIATAIVALQKYVFSQ